VIFFNVGNPILWTSSEGFVALRKVMRFKNWIKKQWNFQYKRPRAGFGPRVIKIQGGYLPNLLTHSVQIPKL